MSWCDYPPIPRDAWEALLQPVAAPDQRWWTTDPFQDLSSEEAIEMVEWLRTLPVYTGNPHTVPRGDPSLLLERLRRE